MLYVDSVVPTILSPAKLHTVFGRAIVPGITDAMLTQFTHKRRTQHYTLNMKLHLFNSLLALSSNVLLCAASSLRGQEHRQASAISDHMLKGAVRASKGLSKPEYKLTEPTTASSGSTPHQLATGTDDALFLGYSVSYAGDVNGDGIDDVIVGAPKKTFDAHHQEVGAAFIIFGRNGALPDLESINYLDGTNGFAVYGNRVNDEVGYSVSHAGDINGDGFSDVLIGAPGVDGFGAAGSGQVFAIFGSDAGFPAVVDLQSLDGSNGFVIQGNAMQDYLGSSVAYAGDVNGDGIDDVIVGAPNADTDQVANGGEVYVIFGSTSGFPDVLFITDLDGSNGFAIESEDESDIFGVSVASAGDVNGDGISDVLIGATGAANANGDHVGATYVIYGAPEFASSFEVSSLDGTNGYKILGTSMFDEFGHSVSAIGDVNGDDVDDFIVGCPRCRPTGGNFYSGTAFVFYGTKGPVASSVDATAANVVISAQDSFDGLGEDVSSAGDVNGDGIPDILIGSGRSVGDKNNAAVYVLYGSSSDLTPSIAVQDLDESSSIGMTIPMYDADFSGKNNRIMSVAFAGDLNNDGMTDVIVGLPNVKVGGDSLEGHVKVVLGNYAQQTER